MSTARNGLQTTQPLTTQPLIESLRHQIRKLETAGRATDAKTISTGCSELDLLLPDRGLATGTIAEWLTPAGGCGAELLSLLAAREACADGGALVVVDPEHRFHPAAAAAWGVDLGNVVVLRGAKCQAGTKSKVRTRLEVGDRRSEGRISHSKSQIPKSGSSHLKSEIPNLKSERNIPTSLAPSLLWAIDQALRCPAVAAVWGCLGHVSERWLRRFQLSAEQSGAMGMFVRPVSVKGQPGWAEVQMEIEEGTAGRRNMPASGLQPPTSLHPSFDRLLSLRLLRVRSGHAPAQPITLQIDFTTGKVQTVTRTHEQTTESKSGKRSPHSVRLASQLANPKTGGHRQRA